MLRIILIEGDDLIRALAVAALRDRGHQPIALPTAVDAIRLMPFVGVDALVAETTPTGGPYLVEQIHRLHPDARIILTSAHLGVGQLLLRARSKGWHVLPRPYRVQDLLALLE